MNIEILKRYKLVGYMVISTVYNKLKLFVKSFYRLLKPKRFPSIFKLLRYILGLFLGEVP